MKINNLLEGITAASSPENAESPAPKFGRSDKFLEEKDEEQVEECTTSGAIASVASPVSQMQRRGKGSIFAGIKTSDKYPNSAAVKEGFNDDNFTAADINKLATIRDLATVKAQAKELIKGKPMRRMKPEKIAYFYDKVDSLTSPMKVVKLMYDLLLAGEGMKTIGSANSMDPNSYQKRFTEEQVNEVDPMNFDSDEDYYNAVKKQGQQQFSGDWDVYDEIASLENQIKYTKSSALAHQLYKQIDQLKQQVGIEDDEDEYEKEYDADIRARKGVAEAAKWRNHPDAYEPDNSDDLDRPLAIQPKGGYGNDELKGRPYSWHEKGKVTSGAVEKKKASIKSSLGKHRKANLPEQDVAEGTGNFAKAIDNLHGWYQVNSNKPELEIYEFDDREGGFYADGTVYHNTKTGRVKIEFQDKMGEYGGINVDETFNSIGDAMNVLRQITIQIRPNSGKAQNFDRLGGRELAGPDDVYKTDRAGKKGTLTKSRMDTMKMSSPYRKTGPKGILPEQGVAEDQLDEKSVSKAQFRTMAAVAHNPKFAKKVGISQKVGKEFHKADKKSDYSSLPSKVDEAEIAEDVLANELYRDLQIFKKGQDKDIGSKAKDKDISSKAKDKEIINKVNKATNEDKDPCWDGYKQIGMKKKGGKQVPNCIPKK